MTPTNGGRPRGAVSVGLLLQKSDRLRERLSDCLHNDELHPEIKLYMVNDLLAAFRAADPRVKVPVDRRTAARYGDRALALLLEMNDALKHRDKAVAKLVALRELQAELLGIPVCELIQFPGVDAANDQREH